MMRGTWRFLALLSLLVPVLITSAGVSGARAMESTAKETNAPNETIQGTIDYMESLGGYFVRGVNPRGEFIIVNQNPKVLKALKASGKTVTIQGYTSNQGAEYFVIQAIDGKKYKGSTSIQ